MASNPFDQFDAPAATPSANPFDKFDAPSGAPAAAAPSSGAPAAAQPTQDLGSTAFWNKPANASWSDYLLAHLAKPFQGADQAAQDYSRTAVDAATFGLGDRFQSYLTGNPLEKERAETAAASSRLGAMAPIVQGAMYAAGPGELGIAKGLGEAAAPVAGKWLGGVLGSGVEGAGAGMIGAAGHDENANQGMALGALTGAAGGIPGGVVGRGGTLAPAVDLATLEANKSGAYQNLGGILYDNADVRQAATNALSEIAQREPRIARNGQGAIDALDEIGNTHALGVGVQSGEDINDFIRSFKKVNTGDSVDEAGQIAQRHFNSLLDNTTPLTGGQAGAGRTALTDANTAYGRLQDTKKLEGWQSKAATGGPDVGAEAQAFLNSTKGQKLAANPDWANQSQALQTLGATARPTQVSAAPSGFDIRHALGPLIGAGIGGAFGGTEGHDPTMIAEEMATGAALGYGAHRIPQMIQGAAQRAAQNRAIAAARTTLSTGQSQAPVLPPANYRDALRSLIFSQGARGAY